MPQPPLRLVIFGPPGSGKSALLGALAQAAETHETTLGGKVVDSTGQLTDLHQRLYSKKDLVSKNAVEKYPVTLKSAQGEQQVELVECGGPAADQLLKSHDHLLTGQIAESILDADALVYVADPSDGGTVPDDKFGEFCVFVRRLEETRGRDNDVAGLPIFLVLSKWDQVAKPSDTASQWLNRIEESKTQIDKKYRDFLDKQNDRAGMAFGTAKVQPWATAVKRPALADRPARPQEPYGVAELFRQVLDSARRFQARREDSRHWLQTLLIGFLGLILIFALIALALYVDRPDAEVALLDSRIQAVLGSEPLREPVRERLDELQKFQEERLYPRLPETTRAKVKDTRDEIELYLRKIQEFLDQVPSLQAVKDQADLKRVENGLRQSLLPEDLRKRWADTRLVKLQEKTQDSVEKLRTAIAEELAWFKQQKEAGVALVKTFGKLRKAEDKERWQTQVRDFVKQPAPHQESQPIPGTGVLYKTVYRFDTVARAKSEWENLKTALSKLNPE